MVRDIETADSSRRAGTVFWITGLSGAGKTTVATALSSALDRRGRPHVRLDGDERRTVFADVDRHDHQARRMLSRRYAGLCRLISHQGLDVVCSTISLFHDIHRWNRDNIENYVEVFLDVDRAVLAARDPKGLYRRADAGELDNVAGLDLAVELPEAPDLTVRNDGRQTPEQVARAILDAADRAPDRQRPRESIG